MMIREWKALREEFPTLAHWTYLDVARKTVAPRCQERALQEYIRDVYENAGAEAWAATNVAETRAEHAQQVIKDAGIRQE
jgi:selenocysteine lyase/cysteine desulfurase